MYIVQFEYITVTTLGRDRKGIIKLHIASMIYVSTSQFWQVAIWFITYYMFTIWKCDYIIIVINFWFMKYYIIMTLQVWYMFSIWLMRFYMFAIWIASNHIIIYLILNMLYNTIWLYYMLYTKMMIKLQ